MADSVLFVRMAWSPTPSHFFPLFLTYFHFLNINATYFHSYISSRFFSLCYISSHYFPLFFIPSQSLLHLDINKFIFLPLHTLHFYPVSFFSAPFHSFLPLHLTTTPFEYFSILFHFVSFLYIPYPFHAMKRTES